MDWLQVVGWAGSALLVYSVLQTRVLRFRTLNLTASAVLAVFNALVGVWPMVGMNGVLVCVNCWFLVKMLRTKRAGRAFDWMAAAPGDPYLDRMIERWKSDIERFRPDAAAQLTDPATRCALIFCGDVTVGLVAFRPAADGVDVADVAGQATKAGHLLVDYVIDSYRDYTPGRFVYSSSGPLAAAGLSQVDYLKPLPAVATYLRAEGFAEQSPCLFTRTIP